MSLQRPCGEYHTKCPRYLVIYFYFSSLLSLCLKFIALCLILVFVLSPQEKNHLSSAVTKTQPVHAVQSLGWTFQHHVHASGPLQ